MGQRRSARAREDPFRARHHWLMARLLNLSRHRCGIEYKPRWTITLLGRFTSAPRLILLSDAATTTSHLYFVDPRGPLEQHVSNT